MRLTPSRDSPHTAGAHLPERQRRLPRDQRRNSRIEYGQDRPIPRTWRTTTLPRTTQAGALRSVTVPNCADALVSVRLNLLSAPAVFFGAENQDEFSSSAIPCSTTASVINRLVSVCSVRISSAAFGFVSWSRWYARTITPIEPCTSILRSLAASLASRSSVNRTAERSVATARAAVSPGSRSTVSSVVSASTISYSRLLSAGGTVPALSSLYTVWGMSNPSTADSKLIAPISSR
ncbi:hypothetical protein Htur_4548 (plasmid) [Haloterrigena turkmenica DSM 5511]|uniref:Uncharacterized protein n=1 Tax=Haloterrigena turkmenica (strain ATCC 51198 / DSM 5511 / JCM 9101 / NCIMB 13204 / VKM B-1734 / 4k) TaxID=543526 RepID=D2S1V2_HALTV|nr:hypothetical protein Htur_4548 [Haloterrigena turkmenica DSM 5511]